MKTPEGYVQGAIMDWLAAKHILAFRMNTGTAKIENRFIRFGTPGMADILAFAKDGTVTWIECKAAKGKQSEVQKSFQRQVEENGHSYILAYSINDVEAYV